MILPRTPPTRPARRAQCLPEPFFVKIRGLFRGSKNDLASLLPIYLSFAPREGILDDTPDGANAVFPIDLLALRVGAPVVGDRDLVNPDALFGELGSDFGLESKAVFLDGNRLNNFPPHGFVAGLHIRKVQVGKHVGHEREEAIAHGVPKVEHPVLLRTNETRTKNRIGFSTQNRMQQNGIFSRIIFQVGILNDHNICRRTGYTRSQGGTLALVFIVVVNTQARIGIFDALQFIPRSITRGIVHHNQLSNLWLQKDSFDNSSYSGPLVEYGHDDGKAEFHV